MKVSVVDGTGAQVREIEVDDAVFGLTPNLAVVHQALLAQLANRRQGTHSTLRRRDHSAATTKSRKQKGSGRARLGSASSPVRVGGAVAHGPHPRSYRQRLPKQMRRLAIRSMLSQRLAEDGLIVLADQEFEPRTRATQALLAALGVARRALVVTARSDDNLRRGIHNLPGMATSPADTISVEALLHHDTVILTETAVRRVEALWGGERVGNKRAPIPAGEVA